MSKKLSGKLLAIKWTDFAERESIFMKVGEWETHVYFMRLPDPLTPETLPSVYEIPKSNYKYWVDYMSVATAKELGTFFTPGQAGTVLGLKEGEEKVGDPWNYRTRWNTRFEQALEKLKPSDDFLPESDEELPKNLPLCTQEFVKVTK